jgi:hypothetical protein
LWSVHLLRLAWCWRRRRERERERVYTFSYTRACRFSSAWANTIRRRELSFDFFSVHIHIDANLSDEDDVDIHIVHSFRPSYDLINNSLFVHIRIRRYTLKEKGDFLSSLLRWSPLHTCSKCTHAYTRSDHCSMYSPLDICRASLTI